MLKGPIGGLNQKKKSISPKSFKKRCQNQSYKPLDSNRKTLIEPKLLANLDTWNFLHSKWKVEWKHESNS